MTSLLDDMRIIPIIICVLTALATATPLPLETYTADGKLTVSFPKGWQVTADLDKGMIAAQQDEKRADAATIVLVLQATASGTADQLLDAVAGSTVTNLKAGKRTTLAGGRGRTLVATGVVGNVKVGIAAVAVLSNGGAAICILIAKDGEVDKLGGTDLAVNVIASMRVPSAAPTPTPSPVIAPTASPPAPAPRRGTAEALKSVGGEDLVGEWGNTGGSVVEFVDSSTGEYRGSTAAFFGESHTIARDGTFTTLLVARSANHTSRDVDSGSVGFEKGFLVLKYKQRKVDAIRTLRVMGFVTVADGTTFMTLVDAYPHQAEVHWEDPAYVANFCGGVVAGVPTHCVGGETWVRSPRTR